MDKRNICWTTLFLLFSQFKLSTSVSSIKVNKELPSNANSFNRQMPQEEIEPIELKPLNFSGPNHLQILKGHCYAYKDSRYEYKICPFENVTQEEIETLHSPYKGVLGVWGEWEIHDNVFSDMVFLEGSPCGTKIMRSIKVHVVCGPVTAVLNVTEPQKCSYEGVFQTPLGCGTNSMTVYPRLSLKLQMEWDSLESKRETIYTEKGYQFELENIFVKAGFKLNNESSSTLREQVMRAVVKKKLSCEQQLEHMQQRILILEAELEDREALIREMKYVDNVS